MNSLNKGVVFAGAVGMALTGSVLGQNLFNNPSFETGTFGALFGSFAGQDAHGAANTGTSLTTTGWSISSWTYASGNTGLSDRWINDSDDTVRAHAGNRYLFLSTTVQSGAGNACLYYSDGAGISFTGGTTYQFSFYAADAGSTGSAPVVGFEVQGGGGPNVIQTVTLPRNAAWSNSNESVIPWALYTFNWTPTTTYTRPAFYWSVFAGTASGSVGNVVLDNGSVSAISVAAVPEAETVAAGIFMAGLVGATWYRRRQAQA
jgi:hypothetical protein